MSEYRNYWDEFRVTQESTKKKILKKPNYIDAINQYRELSHDMEEAEMPEQAAACHKEISLLYEKLQNSPAERRHLIKAAHLYHTARMVRHNMAASLIQETEFLMEECFLKVIEKLIKQGSVRLAGLTCVEAADLFSKFHGWERAYQYLIKGSKLVQSDVYVQVSILNKIFKLASHLHLIEEVLTDMNTIWSSMLKDQPFFEGVIREMLLKLECHIVLLNLKHLISTSDDLDKSTLSYYNNGHWKSSQKLSVMTKHEFTVMYKFIELIKDKIYLEACKVQAIDMARMLDVEGKKLATELLDSLYTLPSIDRGFREIHASGCSDLDKRQKIFELYDSLINGMIALLAISVTIVLSNRISNCDACSLVDSKIDYRIVGSGFHLLLKSNTTISSTTRFMNCEISYLFQIPKGAYIDTDSLNSSLTNHCFVSDRFNVEEPNWSSSVPKLHPIFFHSRRVLRKVFVFNDQLNFPVHLRYHKSMEKDDKSGSVVQAFLSTTKRKDNLSRLEATVPVGKAHHLVVAVGATMSIVFACVLYVLVAAFRSQESNNKIIKSD
uniref:Phosphatidylinositol-glycan biosynthesis class X protein n=1 Tax=Ditylenchus dipsaci TaxID=166011 RepID=A0A915ENL0_9BILA